AGFDQRVRAKTADVRGDVRRAAGDPGMVEPERDVAEDNFVRRLDEPGSLHELLEPRRLFPGHFLKSAHPAEIWAVVGFVFAGVEHDRRQRSTAKAIVEAI